jgi:hypothetical protein
MIKTYLVKRDTIKELLDHLEEFEEKMKKFCSTHPEYSYDISISEVAKPKRPEWQLITNIRRKK